MSIVAYCTWNRNRMKMNQSHWTPTVSRHSHHSPSIFVKCSEWLGFGQQQSLTCPRYKISKRTELLTTTSNLPKKIHYISHCFIHLCMILPIMLYSIGSLVAHPHLRHLKTHQLASLEDWGWLLIDHLIFFSQLIWIYIYMIYMIAYICWYIYIYS